MAVRSFATNNLVEDHDNYVKFMNTRANSLSKEGKDTDILFYKKGMMSNVFKIDTSHKNGKETRYKEAAKIARLTNSIKLWHTIALTYEIWCDCVKKLVDESHTRIHYKKFVNVSDDVLTKFKNRVGLAVSKAQCWYKTNGQKNIIDPCRSLAIYWTYLDIVKDTSHQRYFPTAETIMRAAKIFGYKQNDNPFIMNGKFQGFAVRGRKRGSPMSVIDIAEQAAKEVEEEQKFSWSELFEKYNNINADYDKLLKQNNDLVSYNTSLRVEIEKLKEDMAELERNKAKLNIAANPKNLDTFTLLNIILEKMKDSKMEYILLTIDGMTIDIHPAKTFPFKTDYQIRSSER